MRTLLDTAGQIVPIRGVCLVVAAFAMVVAPTQTAAGGSGRDRAEARDIYARMVAFPTVIGRGEVPRLIEWLSTRLTDGGVSKTDIVILPHKETAAMIVRVRGQNPKLRPMLVSAHLDIVNASKDDWGSDPFELIEKDGKFYGRGAYDNKAGAAAMASTLLRLARDGRRLRRTVIFAFVGDEETALETTAIIAAHPWVKPAEFAINTDAGHGREATGKHPALYLVQGAEKVYASYEITARNPGGHSSRPRADNAIFDLGQVIGKLQSFRSPVASNALSRAYLGSVGKVTAGPLGKALQDFAANPVEGAAAERIFGSPEYVGATRTTCIPTLLRAGQAENALPQAATVTVNCRIFPGESVELVRTRLSGHIGGNADVRSLYPEVVSPVSELRGDVAAAITKSVHKHHPGAIVAPYLESGATDGRIYRSAGIPTFGTSGHFVQPSAANLHGKNENLPVEAFYQTVDHVFDLVVELGNSPK